MRRAHYVTAQAFNRRTGTPVGPSRQEKVSAANPIFAHCDTILEVKETYESFWNDLNPRSTEIVFVSQVTPA